MNLAPQVQAFLDAAPSEPLDFLTVAEQRQLMRHLSDLNYLRFGRRAEPVAAVTDYTVPGAGVIVRAYRPPAYWPPACWPPAYQPSAPVPLPAHAASMPTASYSRSSTASHRSIPFPPPSATSMPPCAGSAPAPPNSASTRATSRSAGHQPVPTSRPP